jgi:hypothetical protein
MGPLRKIIISLVILLGLAAAALPLSWYLRRRAYEGSYSEIRIGDSEQEVVALYGKPLETSDCSEFKRPSYLEKIQTDCVKVYWYKSFLEQWIFFFDRDDRVIHKAYNVLY